LRGWNRAAIAWDLKCDENAKKDRHFMYETLSSEKQHHDNQFTMHLTWIPFMIIFFSLCSCCAGGLFIHEKTTALNEPITIILYLDLVGTVLALVFATLLVIFTPKAIEEKHMQSQKLKKYAVINDCSDKYAKLPENVSDIVLDSISYMEKIPILAYIVLGITVVLIFIEFCSSRLIGRGRHEHDW